MGGKVCGREVHVGVKCRGISAEDESGDFSHAGTRSEGEMTGVSILVKSIWA